MAQCRICPRRCLVDRENGERGYCGETSTLRIARAALHSWEEPPISGANGSGTIFFSGCNLRCVYCQNHSVSHDGQGWNLSEQALAEEMLCLQSAGATNINLVTPTHYTEQLIRVLRAVRPALRIPVVWNSSGYELPETLHRLAGLVDIFLPDFKYASGKLAAAYSAAPDYPEVAVAALRSMYALVGDLELAPDGSVRKGVLVRHLVLPGNRQDSIQVLHRIAETVPVTGVRLSLMSQYTPEFVMSSTYPCLSRRVTSFEYDTVLREAEQIGFDGYFQHRTSAETCYTPPFEGEPREGAKDRVADRGTGVGTDLPVCNGKEKELGIDENE